VEEAPKLTNRKEIERLNKSINSDLSQWFSKLKQALSIEAERGFTNLLGREEHFHSFVSREFKLFPNNLFSKEDIDYFINLSVSFESYPSRTDVQRKSLVTRARQRLHKLSISYQENISYSAPKLITNNSMIRSFVSNSFDNKDVDIVMPITKLNGLGKKIAERFSSIGIYSIFDLLNYYPRDYVDYSSLCRISTLKEGKTFTIVGYIRRCNFYRSTKNRNLSILDLFIEDITGRIKVTKFFAGRRFANYAYLKSQALLYPKGAKVAVSGLVKTGTYGKSFTDPLIEVIDNNGSPLRSNYIGKLLPIYSLTEGLTADRFRSFVFQALSFANSIKDPLPKFIISKHNLVEKSEAIRRIHFPQNKTCLSSAKKRLVFEEFFLFQLNLLIRRNKFKNKSVLRLQTISSKSKLVIQFFKLLPFKLTNAQQKVFSEIEADLSKPEPMSRLVQGDVGSGKTIVSLAASILSVDSGWQVAFMAPTEILAAQHYKNFCKLLIHLNINVELLTGSTSNTNRKRIFDDLSSGSLNIIVGTHALIEEPVVFSRLGLVVVDEQHRFGVKQRNLLLSKGLQPHLLTMTATPIPRTLALSLHGDLDVSQIDELPPGRTPVKTSMIKSSDREKAYELIREEVRKGQQAYFVLPLIEDSDKLNLRSAVAIHKLLKFHIFPDLNVDLLHGKMKSIDKQNVINRFVESTSNVLVSTTVIEVGVDVPAATVMIIDHADRFGLSQLHQLRGRVGRGSDESKCVLINDSNNDLAKQRLSILVGSNDGFEISELDLKLRGPGHILGTKQSGLPDFALANLIEDSEVLELARKEAVELLKLDPKLEDYNELNNILYSRNEINAPFPHLN